jgi:predicted ATPase
VSVIGRSVSDLGKSYIKRLSEKEASVGVRKSGLLSAEVDWERVVDRLAFPFDIPSLVDSDVLDLSADVTFFVGENGTGKSTLLEAIAIASGANPEGGSQNLRYSSRATESALHQHLVLCWRRRPAWVYFLRSETFFNTATAYEEIGGDQYHSYSHGEQFLRVATSLFRPNGVHFLDEPEAALSVRGELSLLARVSELTESGAQFLIATHSPILLAYPTATILEFTKLGIRETSYEETEPYLLTKSFLESPERFLRHLLVESLDVP